MTEFVSPISIPELHIPDDLTLAQFFLDAHHPTRIIRNKSASPWLIDDASGRAVGYEQVCSRVFGLANALKLRFNVGEDQAVCIFSPNDIDYPVAIWAIHRLGAIVTAANPTYTAAELEYQLTITKAVSIIVHPDVLSTALVAAQKCGIPVERLIVIDSARKSSSSALTGPTVDEMVAYGLSQLTAFTERRLVPGEAKTKIAFLSFSSGTTGRPKAVEITHYAPIACIIQMTVHQQVGKGDRFRQGDVAAGCLPFFHIYGLVVVMHWSLFIGLQLVVIPKFEHVKFLESIVKYRITHLYVVPPQIVLLCKHPATPKFDLSHVRWLLCGAAPLSAELTEEVLRVLPDAAIGQGYGMTETSTTITLFPPWQKVGVAGSAGQMMPGMKCRVVKEDGSLAKVGELGELVVSGPSMALGYANDEKATKETFIDGWVRTGDEVVIDENGEIFIVDRLKELLKVRGFQVAPAELEGHILRHPDVADTCVVGVPDEYSGEIPLAFVVLCTEAAQCIVVDPAEGEKIKASIMKHVTDHKAYYKRLAGGVEFVEAIPKNASGKLLRRVLRDKARELRKKPKVQARL